MTTAQHAPLAFTGGRILIMEAGRPEPEALVIVDGRVAAIGEIGILERWPGCERVDLGGRLLGPGFIDAHNHLSLAALQPRWADLSAATGVDDIDEPLRDQAVREGDVGWIRGMGWEEAGDWPKTLNRYDLDALGFDRPVVVTHFSLHMAVVCSRGLDVLGIGRHTPDPGGGLIERDAAGEPTGLLIERAWSQAHAASVAAYLDPDRWEEQTGLESTLDAFAGVARRDDSDQRFRVEHATLASPAQLTRLAELGGVAVVQPGFLPQLGSRVSSLGFDDATWMPFADLVRAGVPIAASSDHPCGDWEPLAVSCHGATRWTGREVFGADQALAYEDWLRAWTAGSAYAGGQEHERGRLAPGLRADLVILDGTLDPAQPPSVSETWVAGRRCYAA